VSKKYYFADRPTRLTSRCTRNQHKECQSVQVDCICSCHGEEK